MSCRRSICYSPMNMRLSAALIAALLVTTSLRASDVTVAAASDLNFAIKEIIGQFEKATANHVKLSLGSSGNFYAQISNGAPFEVFISADASYPQQLEAAGKAAKGTAFVYAFGKIVLWVPNTSKLDLKKLQMKALLDPSIRKIAIANPVHA